MRKFYSYLTLSRFYINDKSIPRWGQVKFYAAQQTGSKEILTKYSKEDGERILKLINNSNAKDLLGYDITKGRANKLLAWRMRNGLLSNLSDIFMIEGFGLKATEKFYQSLLQDPKPVDVELGKSNRMRTAPFITPSLEPEKHNKINSCVSLRIGVNSITWSKLKLAPCGTNQPCELTHWQHHDISEKKLHIHELIQRCLYVNHQIPNADCYLFENPQMAQVSNNPGSVDQQNINIQKSQVTAIMGYALAARNSQLEEIQNTNRNENGVQRHSLVFYVRRFLTARLFNHLVGTERVSSEDTILNMMRTYYNMNEMEDVVLPNDGDEKARNDDETTIEKISFRGNVQFPMNLRQMFSNAPRYHREYLGQALLLNLTFVRLVLLQDAESIAKVSRGKTRNDSFEDI
ncbi:uncharacterized protein LOC142234828 [Haematobia irritans]|uniref:uncharacterized protein LOC142234828 n=1 Tax=Haematobia irritans TaxID=7368 RepID=UPI003F4F43C1